MNLPNFMPSDANCTYTTSNGENVCLTIDALLKLISEIPEKPKIFRMNIDVFRHPLLSENWIFLSDSVADALEQAIENAKTDKKATAASERGQTVSALERE